MFAFFVWIEVFTVLFLKEALYISACNIYNFEIIIQGIITEFDLMCLHLLKVFPLNLSKSMEPVLIEVLGNCGVLTLESDSFGLVS